MVEQGWWNSGTVLVEQCGGTVDECWWNSVVEQCGGTVKRCWWHSVMELWNRVGGTVEQCRWNSETVLVE